ncbi:MAG: glycoside hydrolase family 2 protein [Solirubrobacteraceae bacterium]|nr:glycoside hydrolase family 2 protein [Solirubrobacteraceae bacterium]
MAPSLGAWETARAEPGEHPHPGEIDGLSWTSTAVPCTTAQCAPGVADPDAYDWWFRTSVRGAAEGALLKLGGLATVADVYLDGGPLLHSSSMFLAHEIELPPGAQERELAICCRALAPLLAEPRKPRARWRTRLVADNNLRWWRTSLIGRAPGFSPGPPIVGPWRPVTVAALSGPRLQNPAVRTRMDGEDGVVELSGTLSGAQEVEVGIGDQKTTVAAPGGAFATAVRVPEPARWWPHTHGEPVLYELTVAAGETELLRRGIGFRELAAGASARHDVLEDGLDLHVNGVGVFARGALWTHVAQDEVRPTLELLCAGGMNMIRVPGTGVYESDAFHDACDELGVLVWQDFMFANMDYPIADDAFRALVEREAAQVSARLAARPSTVVLCGNSEVEQQVAMLGLDPGLGRGELFADLLPAAAETAGADAVYVPSAPSGNGLPIRPDRGVANYFGVGGYRRPIEDARRAEVRFASECLALANVPAGDPADRTEGVQRDVGADWDFADVRDHYLARLYGTDPQRLLAEDPVRYYELSRVVSGELMSEVFGEWRRMRSSCGGGLVLWLRDLVAGSGWGLLDHAGRPKPVWHHLRRALAPVALWSTDEGLGGIGLHLANDGPVPVHGELRVRLYRDLEVLVGEAEQTIELAAHAGAERNVEDVLGRFVDAAWAYRFGPPAQDAVVATFDTGSGAPLMAVRFPAGYPPAVGADELGLQVERAGEAVVIRSRKLAHAVRIRAAGFTAADDGFTVAPGSERRVELVPDTPGAAFAGCELVAANLRGQVLIGP